MEQMKKIQKMFWVLIFVISITLLFLTHSYAAKVCVANSLHERFLSGYRNWYCGNNYPTVAYNTTDHGGSDKYCWCVVGGDWVQVYYNVSSTAACMAYCQYKCGL
jgi:hypothetical protein